MILDKTSLEVMILDKTSLEVMIVDETSLGVMILDKNLSRSDNGEKPEMEAGSEKNCHC